MIVSLSSDIISETMFVGIANVTHVLYTLANSAVLDNNHK